MDGIGDHVPSTLGQRLSALAPFAEPVRRALYEFVVGHGTPVSREQAAEGVGVPHHVAKFHLDKLEEEGLLETEYRRPPGRSGPGAGRPTKLYRRSARQIEVSIPERRYELAGRLLAEAVAEANNTTPRVGEALERAATRAGAALGAAARKHIGGRRGAARVTDATLAALREAGYEPQREPGAITLHNCPFHALAQDYTALVCGMNLALLKGLLAEAGADHLDAELDPKPGRCCVVLRPAAKR